MDARGHIALGLGRLGRLLERERWMRRVYIYIYEFFSSNFCHCFQCSKQQSNMRVLCMCGGPANLHVSSQNRLWQTHTLTTFRFDSSSGEEEKEEETCSMIRSPFDEWEEDLLAETTSESLRS